MTKKEKIKHVIITVVLNFMVPVIIGFSVGHLFPKTVAWQIIPVISLCIVSASFASYFRYKVAKVTRLKEKAFIEAYQKCSWVHPLTCGNNSNHKLLYPIIMGGKLYLACPDCYYVQAKIPDCVFDVDIINDPLNKIKSPAN
jgi:hypothetical protein